MSTDIRAAVPSWQPETRLLDRFRGFGNHYFLIKRIFINRACCDNRDYGRTRKEYLDNKRKDYMASLESFDRGIAVHEDFVMISNCGNIQTEKSEDGMDRDLIKFIYGRKVMAGGRAGRMPMRGYTNPNAPGRTGIDVRSRRIKGQTWGHD